MSDDSSAKKRPWLEAVSSHEDPPITKEIDRKADPEAYYRSLQNAPTVEELKIDILYMAVRPPTPIEYVRVHPDVKFHYRCQLARTDEKKDQFYLVVPAMQGALKYWTRPFILYRTINLDGDEFWWPIAQAHNGREQHNSPRTAELGAFKAIDGWFCLVHVGDAYEAIPATVANADPVWNGKTVWELLDVAFGNCQRIIDSPDHYIAHRFRGGPTGNKKGK